MKNIITILLLVITTVSYGQQIIKPHQLNTGQLKVDEVNNRIGIGTTTPVSQLHVAGTVTATSFVETSSARYKTNIQPLDYTDVVSKLVPVSYIVKETNKPDIGFIAEDMDKVISQLVMYNDKGEPEAINYTKLIPILVKEIQELRKEIEILKTK